MEKRRSIVNSLTVDTILCLTHELSEGYTFKDSEKTLCSVRTLVNDLRENHKQITSVIMCSKWRTVNRPAK